MAGLSTAVTSGLAIDPFGDACQQNDRRYQTMLTHCLGMAVFDSLLADAANSFNITLCAKIETGHTMNLNNLENGPEYKNL